MITGWTRHGDNEYFTSDDQLNQADARRECQRMGSELTSIHSITEYNNVRTMASP